MTDAPTSKGLKTADVFREGERTMEPHVEDYCPRQRADRVLQGNYQKVYNT